MATRYSVSGPPGPGGQVLPKVYPDPLCRSHNMPSAPGRAAHLLLGPRQNLLGNGPEGNGGSGWCQAGSPRPKQFGVKPIREPFHEGADRVEVPRSPGDGRLDPFDFVSFSLQYLE